MRALKLGLACLIVLAAVAVSAGASGQAQSTAAGKAPVDMTMTIYIDHYKDGWKALVNAINANPSLGVKLTVDQIPGGQDGINIIKLRYASNEIADFLEANGVGEPYQAKAMDKVVPLTGDWVRNFDPVMLSSSVYSQGGKIYAVPVGSINAGGMLYNKKVFQSLGLSIPKTHQELLAISQKIKDAGKVPVFVSGKDSWTLQVYSIVGYSREWTGHDDQAAAITQAVDKNKANWADRTLFWDSLLKYKDLVDKGFVNPTWMADTYDMAEKALANGDAAMYPMATWIFADLASKFPDQVNDIGGFAIPFEGNNAAPAWAAFGIMMNTTAKDKTVGMRLMNYIGSPEAQKIFVTAQPGIPPIKGIDVKLYPGQLDLYKTFSATGRGGLIYQALTWPDGPSYDTGLDAICMRVLSGLSTVTDEAKALDELRIKAGKAQGIAGY